MNRNRARKKNQSANILFFYVPREKNIFFTQQKKLPADNLKYKAHNQKYV